MRNFDMPQFKTKIFTISYMYIRLENWNVAHKSHLLLLLMFYLVMSSLFISWTAAAVSLIFFYRN